VTVIEDFRSISKSKMYQKKGKFLIQNTALTFSNKIKATFEKHIKGLLRPMSMLH
jgi:hypothetical protein